MIENTFIKNLKNYPEKYSLFIEAYKKGLVQEFDNSLLTRLRKIYYGGFFQGILYFYYLPTDFENIGNKVELLAYLFKDEDFEIVHGDTFSTRKILFHQFNQQHLDFNSWIEVKKGNVVWVYDTFSLLKFEKDLFYELEEPNVKKTVTKSYLNSIPKTEDDNFEKAGSLWMLVRALPIIEANLENNPYKEVIEREIIKLKNTINYDDLVKKAIEEEKHFQLLQKKDS